MESKTLTCINCPIGCVLTVSLDGREIREVTGNACGRGVPYARQEVTNPTRMMTSTVRLQGGVVRQVPVKTASQIPKDMVTACVKALTDVTLEAPVRLGQVVLPDVLGTGVDIIATRSVEQAGHSK